ncbi:PREDICTED: nuclear polyadenylated RNA-binding protein 3 [Bactrocera latifrons]|uniref:nuclear polyadenylated RNA-binding protein 3 n=1 Tax=Bactrocera latifrons TaxID=174628 RepID=UPI0008DC88C3|nr:PREDICTED: nuclear polyadenylated RNA-binding protein 3 [Bactrocera latifrons]
MAENDNKQNSNANLQIIRDPNLAKNRIFVGNLPTCTREQLESICLPYGKVLGSLVQKNFGFVQFESEEIANKVASSLSKSIFKGNVITVRNAASKQAPKRPASDNVALPTNINTGYFGVPESMPTNTTPNMNPDYNDCEIIVIDRRNTKYAEYIEQRLKDINLRVDVLFPNEDVPLGKVLINISSRGCLYAILITPQHEEHNSITVNILYGQPAEHRNMPVDDAIMLISKDFRQKMANDVMKKASFAASLPKPMTGVNMGNPMQEDRHPSAIQTLLNLLSDNMPLTVLQYDRIIKYLQERREHQVKIELGDAADIGTKVPDPEIELQKRILDIMNKPSVAETHYKLLYPTLEAVRSDYRAMDLLKDVRVQKALETLMDSNLVGTVENYMKY